MAGDQPDIDALTACKEIKAEDKRLACYDDAMGNEESEAPTRPRQANHEDASLFGRDDRATAQALSEKLGIEEVEAISSTIDKISQSPHGKIVVTLSNSQVWRQVDSARLPLSRGDKVTVRSASFGSYLLEKASGSRAIKVKRVDN